jgi:hypothetical protein
MSEWSTFGAADGLERRQFSEYLAHLNYFDRVVFYGDKPLNPRRGKQAQ